MIYNGMKLGLLVGKFPDTLEQHEYLKPENFKYFETADFKHDYSVEFKNGIEVPMVSIDMVYDIGNEYVIFANTVEFNKVTPVNVIMLVRLDIETDDCNVVYVQPISALNPNGLKATIKLQVKRRILNLGRTIEYFEMYLSNLRMFM